MKYVKLTLRIIATPIIAIPVILLGWATMTIAGITIIAGILGIVFLPFCWIVDNKEGISDCLEIIEIAYCGIAYPFLYLYYFVIGGEEFKEIQL